MKIALVHDFLREYGGAERVVEALHEMWPEAPLYTSFVDWGNLGHQGKRFKDWDIRTSWVQNNPIVKTFHSPLRFLAPKIWESFDLRGYDVILSSSGWFMCRGVRVHEPTIHICYIHHPPRNLYGYATGSDIQKYWPVRAYSHVVNFFLRHYDFETAQKVDFFVANSKETARRVWKFYRRESTVIYPPVDIQSTNLPMTNLQINSKSENRNPKKYFLSVGRLSWAKRVDLAILACNELNVPLIVAGTGKEENYLRSIAGPTIEFAGNVDDATLHQLYQGAKALVFCALDEDFGIVPVEAMGHGVPVIALGQGGVLETVIDGKTGILFDKPTVLSLKAAFERFNKSYNRNNYYNNCRKQAQRFSKARFQKEIRRFVEKKVSSK